MTVARLRPEGVAWQEVDGEIVCLDLETSRYLSINATGGELWPLLVEGAETAALVDRLVTAFGIDQETAERDVGGFLSDLRGRGLLES